MIETAPDLAIVANIAVGYDNIDVPSVKARGVVVTNTPDVLTEATAELTWALILAVTRRIGEGERLVRRGEWRGWALDFMLGMELRGKQLGHHRPRTNRPGGGGKSGGVRHDRRSSRSTTCRSTSCSSAPTSCRFTRREPPQTRHMIDRRALARMKRSAFLVNTARGTIVDEDALVWALGEHLIAGAALDVFEKEPVVHPGLLTLENVVLVPHLGSATRETRTAMADLAVSNVLAVLDGRPPLTPV